MPSACFYPLGYPVEISSDFGEALCVASKLWASWPSLFDASPLHIHVHGHSGAGPRRVPSFIAPGGALIFRSDNVNSAKFEPAVRHGFVSIAIQSLTTPLFRHHFLEALVLTALDAVFFTPLHAACVSRGGVGVLLCGDSGAGKSSLAYECARRGWTLVSDDVVHLAPGRRRIGVGGSNTIRLRPPAHAIFPHLAEFPAGIAPNGKQAIDIDAAAHGFRAVRSAAIHHCVFLKRRLGRAAWDDFDTGSAVDYFLKYLAPRDTTRAGRRLKQFVKSPVLLEYEHVDDAARALETFIEAGS